ncbi:PaaK1 [Desulforapulum autotrophicum HRM2]|uniref:Phenylacetate-coenzyme A ligase n=1 Tax=Desulforapulum autotrophicum (strain ATCC 43914 / DSM 3382 / VKM B-1955 / HRM2) TaxID=177437 RepID=C0QDI3_DESAH|nr:phenylacetate--CoA ligase [Desulforapulum autotrophicum]ACN15247.1 PaaK1 [Desulforapulum autotrophicum HRM2]
MGFIPQGLTKEDIEKIQLDGLKWTVNHGVTHSRVYQRTFKAAGIEPGDVQSLKDLESLPFLEKMDLQDDYPLPLRSVPEDQVVRIHGSSGTTGKRKVMCYTQRDIDTWADMFARCYELSGMTTRDRVHIAVGYGLWTAGAGFQLGCERFGAMAIPMGPVNTDMHVEMLVDMQSTVFCSTASMALLMAEEVKKRDLRSKINLKRIILGAERHSNAMRAHIGELLNVSEIHDIYGLTELYGPGTGIECKAHQGMHYWNDLFIYEIIDPDTLKPVPEGEFGELVITSLQKEASPLIRYRTHDITRLLPGDCPCGLAFPRHDRIQGRSDDMFIYRAVNIYPQQIDLILDPVPEVGSEYQVILDHQENGRDMMTIRVERSEFASSNDDAALVAMISDRVRRKLLVRAAVEITDYHSLPRTQKKSQRVFDNRNGNSR